MKRLMELLSCKSNQAAVTKDKFREEPDDSEAAAQYAFLNPPSELMHPSLCLYVLTKEVATKVDFDALIHALRTNDCLVRIHIMGSFVTELSVLQQELFWNVVCQVPNLRSIGFLYFNSLNASLLKRLLDGRERYGQSGIEELEMSHVVFQGDLAEVSLALQNHTTLRSMSLWNVNPVEGGNSNDTNAFLQMILDNHHLHNLLLGSFCLDEPQIDIIARAVSHPNHQLQHLRLIGIARDANPNHQHATNHPQQGNRLTHKSCQALAQMLQVNQTLLELELTNLQLVNTNNTKEDSGLCQMIRALQYHNRTLKSFQLFQRNLFSRHDMTPVENDALMAMLGDNQVLERCLPQGGTGDVQDWAQFHLKLNRFRLRGIQVDVNRPRISVLRILAALKGDLDCIYHVLRESPSLVPL